MHSFDTIFYVNVQLLVCSVITVNVCLGVVLWATFLCVYCLIT